MKFLLSLIFFSQTIFAAENVRLINVDGVVEKSFKPNMVSLSIIVWAKADKAKEALKDQVEESDRAKKVIKKFKIEDKDVMTVGFDLSPNYFWDQKANQNVINGYNATESINITLRNIDDAGKLIDEISSGEKKSGVNINNINWDISNREDVQKDLLSEAVKVAAKKAELLATAAGVKIKRVFAITPGSTSFYAPPMANMKMMADGLGGARESAAPQFQSGQIKVSNSVTVNFEIE